MRRRTTLLTQVLAVNAFLVALTATVAALVVGKQTFGWHEGLLILLAVACVLLLNSILLRRRLRPVNRLIQAMEKVEDSSTAWRGNPPQRAAVEVQRLTAAFNSLLDRLEAEHHNAS